MSSRSNLISAQELRQHLERADVRVVDCRFDLGDRHAGRRAYEAGHIPGAVFADLDSDLSAPIGANTGRHPLPEAAEFASTLGRLGIDNATDVVVYDGGAGSLAARAWWMLRWLGHERTRLLDGGFRGWETQGFPVVAGIENEQIREFTPQVREDLIVTTRELATNLQQIAGMKLLDARDPARFRGDVEPIDTVAGHIPGSSNVPFQRSLDATGYWRPRQELEALWSSVLGEHKDAAWMAMCGSGVTACHLAISAVEAGYREPRLYVGSWSEWIRDPSRPVGLGGDRIEASQAADIP